MTVNSTSQKRAILINDMSCFGKCSLTVSLPIISAYGVEAVPLPTAILSTHTGGFPEFSILDMSEEMQKISKMWERYDIRFDLIYTGYFSNIAQIDFALDFIKKNRNDSTLVVVDTVMGDNGKLYTGFTDKFVEKMKELARVADIITPNLTEARFLTNMPDAKPEDVLKALGHKCAVITGIRNGDKIGILGNMQNKLFRYNNTFYDITLHGSGDVFASFLVGELLLGNDFETSAKNALSLCGEAVFNTYSSHEGINYGLQFEKVLAKRFLK